MTQITRVHLYKNRETRMTTLLAKRLGLQPTAPARASWEDAPIDDSDLTALLRICARFYKLAAGKVRAEFQIDNLVEQLHLHLRTICASFQRRHAKLCWRDQKQLKLARDTFFPGDSKSLRMLCEFAAYVISLDKIKPNLRKAEKEQIIVEHDAILNTAMAAQRSVAAAFHRIYFRFKWNTSKTPEAFCVFDRPPARTPIDRGDKQAS